MALFGEGYHPAMTCGQEEGPWNMKEDFPHSRLGTAMVERVLPSMKSIRRDGPYCQEPSPD